MLTALGLRTGLVQIEIGKAEAHAAPRSRARREYRGRSVNRA